MYRLPLKPPFCDTNDFTFRSLIFFWLDRAADLTKQTHSLRFNGATWSKARVWNKRIVTSCTDWWIYEQLATPVPEGFERRLKCRFPSALNDPDNYSRKYFLFLCLALMQKWTSEWPQHKSTAESWAREVFQTVKHFPWLSPLFGACWTSPVIWHQRRFKTWKVMKKAKPYDDS